MSEKEVMPKQYPMVDSSDQTSSAEVSRLPALWPDMILGQDKYGRKMTIGDVSDHDPKPIMPNKVIGKDKYVKDPASTFSGKA